MHSSAEQTALDSRIEWNPKHNSDIVTQFRWLFIGMCGKSGWVAKSGKKGIVITYIPDVIVSVENTFWRMDGALKRHRG